MMVRLLQAFSEISWDPDACLEAMPPAEWATESEGSERKKIEKAFLKSHLTMYAHVCSCHHPCFAILINVILEGILGKYERI
jgi:hypothetical protein